MPRSLRIEFPGAFYHVMARGNRRETIFHDDDDRRFFLATLLQKFGIDGLTPAEEAELSHELSQAYHMDESSASSRDVQRIAEKIRARLQQMGLDTSLGITR